MPSQPKLVLIYKDGADANCLRFAPENFRTTKGNISKFMFLYFKKLN